MTQPLARGVVRVFRLTDEPGGLGLSCTPSGVSLACVPLLRKTRVGFAPRPASEVASLLKAAYGDSPTGLQSRLGVIAQALNSGDIAKAMIAAVHTRTPELSPEAALRLAKADRELTKYNYNPDEPRDWNGRWTRDGSPAPPSIAAPGVQNDQGADQYASAQRQRVAENGSATTTGATASPNSDDGDAAKDPASLERTFERKYDDLGPADFARQVIEFGDWLGRTNGNLSPDEKARALAEYSFLQDRLSFWLNYDYKPVTAQGNLLSAALTLYQGAVNGRIARVGHLPESMLAAAGAALLSSGSSPERPYKKPIVEEVAGAPLATRKEVERFGPVVDNSDIKIIWGKGIDDQGEPLETYLQNQNPGLLRLKPKTTTFDLLNLISREAISAKTLNTLSVSYIRRPQSIYRDERATSMRSWTTSLLSSPTSIRGT